MSDPQYVEGALRHLERAEQKETDPWLRDDIRIAWITVLEASRGNSHPHNPELYGRKPNDARVFAVMGAQAVAASGLSYFLKKKHAHVWKLQLWTVPLTFEAQAHVVGAIHNIRTCK